MEKNAYIAPSMEEVNVVVAHMLSSSSVRISDETTDEDAILAGERRGVWGDFWN